MSTPKLSDDDVYTRFVNYLSTLIPDNGITSNTVKTISDISYRYITPPGYATAMFFVLDANGKVHYAPNYEIDYNKRAAYDDFDIEIVEGEYTVNEDGSIMLNSDAIIRVIPKKANINAIIGAKTLDGAEEVTFSVNVVDDHECNGEYMIIAQPTEDEGATIASFCEICNDLVECKVLPNEVTTMLSNGYSYQDISDALNEANKSDEELKLYIFGNVNIDENITIPDDLTLVIVPETKITVNDNCKFIAKGEVNDFSGYDYDLSGKGPIVPVITTSTTSTSTTSTSTATTSATTTGTTTTSATSTSAATTSTASTSATTTSTTTTSAATTSAITTFNGKSNVKRMLFT